MGIRAKFAGAAAWSVAAIALDGGITEAIAGPPTYRGLFIVIDPYNHGGICATDGQSVNWLIDQYCPKSTTYNSVKHLLEIGTITGVFFHINWSDWKADSNHTTLDSAFSSLGSLTQANHVQFSITIGMGAGVNIPSSVYMDSLLGPVYLPNNDPVTGAECDCLPEIWEDPSNYSGTYASDLVTLVNEAATDAAAYGAGTITAVKLSGINTKTQELYIVGQNQDYTPAKSDNCVGASTTQTCSINAESALAHYGYSPIEIANAWNSIVSNVYGSLHTQSIFSDVVYEADVTGLNAFPPLVAKPTANGALPDFDCAINSCVLDTGLKVGPSALPAGQADGYYFSQDLLTDVVSSAYSDLPSSVVATQTDGLMYGTYTSQNGTVTIEQNPNSSDEPLPLPCWGYKTLQTAIGFQSAGLNSYNSMLPFTASDYLTGLQNGVNYGASYEELFSDAIQQYTMKGGSDASLSSIAGSLISSNTGTGTCGTLSLSR